MTRLQHCAFAGITLLVACGSPTQRSRPATPPSASAPPAPAPKLVIQARVYTKGIIDFMTPYGLVASHRGKFAAVFGPDLQLIDIETGAVRGVFPGCVLGAAFEREDKGMLVIGCPAAPLDGPPSSANPVADVMRWDFATDTVTKITSGPFESIEVADDGAFILRGLASARVLEPTDFHVRAAFEVPPSKDYPFAGIQRVSSRGDRALSRSDSGTISLMKADGRVTPFDDSLQRHRSGDLRRLVTVEKGHFVATDTDSGTVLGDVRVDAACSVVAVNHAGNQVLLDCSGGSSADLELANIDGTTVCSISPSAGMRMEEAKWASDGQLLLVAWRKNNEETLIEYEARNCSIRSSEPGFWLPTSDVSDELVVMNFLEAPGLTGRLGVLSPFHDPARIELGFRPALEPGPMGVIARRGARGWRFDPASETTHELPTPDEHDDWLARDYGNAPPNLRARTADGRVLELQSRIPERTKELFLVDDKGAQTMLEHSQAYVGSVEQDAVYRCFASPKGLFVGCNSRDDQGEIVAVWSAATGRRVAQHRGRSLVFSADEARVLTLDLNRPDKRSTLFDTASGQLLAELLDLGAFSADGQLVLGEEGVYDATTGKALWAPGPGAEWLGDRILVRREAWTPRYFTGPAGRFDARDGRTGAPVKSLGAETAIVQILEQAGLVLTSDNARVFHVRDLGTLEETFHFGPYVDARLSEDGKFAFASGRGPLHVLRLADGAEILQIHSEAEGGRGLSYTADGFFDGGPEALGWVAYRVGGVTDGRLLGRDAVEHDGFHPGLAAEFFAGQPLPRR
ncbi:MAG: hypothetical protein U0414_08930 [Polyangiaceae bacterium]